ncbi:MFS general substrate transporter [Stipitochalara longipes BDJ]|nr:MFS general substrate transporter [Stipitochalara longipes BDJ]
MASSSLEVEHQGSLADGNPNESSPLLRVSSNNSKTSISITTTKLSASEEATDVDVDVSEIRQKNSPATVLPLLLIGVLIASADGSLVIATAPTISSHFLQLESVSWLLTSYSITQAAAQPVLAKMSDVFGRKRVLLLCYVLFALGNPVTGVGQEFWQVVAGRAIAGSGGAGMAYLVPKIEVASWRSYVNVVTTFARSLGSPLGGWLADSIGWSFIGQATLSLFAFLIVAWRLVNPPVPLLTSQASPKPRSTLGRIDYIGSILMAATIITFILAVSPVVISLLIISGILGTFFAIVEQKYASEPIFPLRLLFERNVASSYAIIALQMAAQMSMLFSIPLCIQVTSGASNAKAGSYLVPAMVGNTVGGLMTGFIIKRTGKYKNLLWLAAFSSCFTYVILIFTWHGRTSPLASLALFPSGFRTGIAGATTFVVLTSYLPQNDFAVATGGIYLTGTVGLILGLSLSSSLQRGMLRGFLAERGVKSQVIQHVLDDVLYHVVQGYVDSLEYSHVFSLIRSALTLLFSYSVWKGDLE